jgi:hypothetical protein
LRPPGCVDYHDDEDGANGDILETNSRVSLTNDDAWTAIQLVDSYTNPTNRSLPLGTSFMGTNLGSS